MSRIGFARKSVTPSPGAEMPGLFHKRYGAEAHDDLWVTAMLVECRGREVGFVGVDALSLRRDTVLAARQAIRAHAGIPGESVMIAASHTHNGGPTANVFLSEADAGYCSRVAEAIGLAVREARAGLADARFVIGSGAATGIAFNRRFRMSDGSEATHPGKGNRKIIGPAGPADPEVGVIGAFRRSDDVFLGCFVNFTCHCTVDVGGAGFSADWPFYLRRGVAAAMGNPDAVVCFGNGACGDVTQVDNLSAGPREFGEAWGRHVGMSVAGEVLKVLTRVEDREIDTVDSRSRMLPLERREIGREELRRARALLQSRAGDGADWDRELIQAREVDLLARDEEIGPDPDAELQALRIGPAVIAGNPAELFCRFGLDIKAASPFKPTWVVELANGCIGYVPGYGQVLAGQGYEPRLARSSMLAPDTGQRIVEASDELLEGLR